MRRRSHHIFGLVVAVAVAVADPSSAAAKTRPVLIRAFGDSAYIHANAAYGKPPRDWVKHSLGAVAALRSPDVNFLNLEGSLARSCRAFAKKPFAFAVAPQTLTQFAAWGFNLVGLANNHSLDCLAPAPGPESAASLKRARAVTPVIAAHGVAKNAAALAKIARLTIRGVRIGLVALKAWNGGAESPVANMDNRAAIFAALRDAAVDVRILSLHGGEEGTRQPTAAVTMLAREFVARYGGDLVFAHHPHKSQGFELLRKPDGRTAAIFYSLGNFLHNGLSPAGDGLVASVAVTKAGVDPASLAAFPLAHPALGPAPVTKAGLQTIKEILKASDAAVALGKLPKGLERVPFKLRATQRPVPGLKLEVTKPVSVAAVRP